MKIEFEDHSYIEIEKTADQSKVLVTVCARDSENNNVTMISLDIDIDKLKEMIESLEKK